MKMVDYTIRIDESLLKKANYVFDNLNLGLNKAIVIFLNEACKNGKMPFEINSDEKENTDIS